MKKSSWASAELDDESPEPMNMLFTSRYAEASNGAHLIDWAPRETLTFQFQVSTQSNRFFHCFCGLVSFLLL